MTTPYTIDPQTLLEAHAKTTQGTWETGGYHDDRFVYCDDEIAEFNREYSMVAEDEANAAFCVLAHNGIVEIVKRLKNLEELLIKFHDACEKLPVEKEIPIELLFSTPEKLMVMAIESTLLDVAAQIKQARKQ